MSAATPGALARSDAVPARRAASARPPLAGARGLVSSEKTNEGRMIERG